MMFMHGSDQFSALGKAGSGRSCSMMFSVDLSVEECQGGGECEGGGEMSTNGPERNQGWTRKVCACCGS